MADEIEEPLHDLHAQDVLSYSAGSTQTGPSGYRKLKPRKSLLDAAGSRWPDLLEALGERTIMFINAYPATVGVFSAGITIDTYLSPRVLTRALQLGKVAGHPVILLGQPLFLADALLAHVKAGHLLPDTLMLWVGGYTMPRSLEQMLNSLLQPHVTHLLLVQYFGAAEVDAGCMMARERDEKGELIYYPREDVKPELDGDKLLLTLYEANGETVIVRFPCGDLARRHGSGYIIWNPKRLHPRVHAAMESWGEKDWRRRTGYLRRMDDEIWIQLREGVQPNGPDELAYFEFAGRFGFSWLNKPYWR